MDIWQDSLMTAVNYLDPTVQGLNNVLAYGPRMSRQPGKMKLSPLCSSAKSNKPRLCVPSPALPGRSDGMASCRPGQGSLSFPEGWGPIQTKRPPSLQSSCLHPRFCPAWMECPHALPPPLLANAPQMGFLHGLQEKQDNRRFLFTETEPLERFLVMIPK